MVSQERGAEAPAWGITTGGRRKALVTCGFSGLNSSEGVCRAVKGLARMSLPCLSLQRGLSSSALPDFLYLG